MISTFDYLYEISKYLTDYKKKSIIFTDKK